MGKGVVTRAGLEARQVLLWTVGLIRETWKMGWILNFLFSMHRAGLPWRATPSIWPCTWEMESDSEWPISCCHWQMEIESDPLSAKAERTYVQPPGWRTGVGDTHIQPGKSTSWRMMAESCERTQPIPHFLLKMMCPRSIGGEDWSPTPG